MSSPVPGFFDPSDETVSIPAGQLPDAGPNPMHQGYPTQQQAPQQQPPPPPDFTGMRNLREEPRTGPEPRFAQPPPGQPMPPWADPRAGQAGGQPSQVDRSAGRQSRRSGVPLAQVLPFLTLITLPVGLLLPTGGSTFWSTAPAWSLFAIACGLVQLAPMLGAERAGSPQRVWQLTAASAAGLVVFWLLLVLPDIASNAAFLLSVATGAAIASAWLARGRTDAHRK